MSEVDDLSTELDGMSVADLEEILLSLGDYERPLVDMNTFLDHPDFLGGFFGPTGCLPFWRDILNDIYPSPYYSPYWLISLRGCLAGDTEVMSLEGIDIPIKDIVRDFSKDKEFWVMSFNTQTKDFEPAKVTDAFLNGYRDIYEITLDNGKKIKCTSCHKFLSENNKWISIDSGLVEGVSLYPYSQREWNGYYWMHSKKTNKWEPRYRTVAKWKTDIPNDFHVHHKNFIKVDDTPSNLCVLNPKDHFDYHARHGGKVLKKWRDSLSEDEWKEIAGQRADKGRDLTWNSDLPKYQKARETHRAKLQTHMLESGQGKRMVELAYQKDPELRNKVRANMITYNQSEKGRSESKRRASHMRDLLKTKSPEEIKLINLKKGLSALRRHKGENSPEVLARLAEIRVEDPNYNHAVLSIKKLGSEPVYDLTVERNHNFVLSSGIVAHNCIGAGKTTTACIGIAYDLYKLLEMISPQRVLGLGVTHTKIVFSIYNATLSLATDVGWDSLTQIFMNSPYFYQYTGDMTKRRSKDDTLFPKRVDIQVGSRIGHSLGKAIFGSLLDEANFEVVHDQMYNSFNSLVRRMESRFLGNQNSGKVWVVSSETDKFSTMNKIVDSYKHSAGVRVVQEPIWNVHPTRYTSNKYFFMYKGSDFRRPSVLKDDDKVIELEPESVIKVPYEHYDSFIADPDACFTGDTKISLLDGTEVPIQDLVGREEFWVYSCKPDGTIVPGRGHSARVTKHVTELVEVTLDNDEVIECTPDHRFMLRNGTYKEAQYLVDGESLMPLYRKLSKDGYESILNNRTNKWRKTYQMVAGSTQVTPERYKIDSPNKCWVIHHSDFRKENNNPSNLVWIGDFDHIKLHGDNIRKNIHENSELRAKSIERVKSPERRALSSKTMSKVWEDNSEALLANIHKQARKNVEENNFSKWSKSGWESGAGQEGVEKRKAQFALEEKPEWVIKHLARSSVHITEYNKSEEHRKVASEVGKTHGKRALRKYCDEHNQDPAFRKKQNIGRCKKVIEKCLELGLEVTADNYEMVRTKVFKPSGYPTYSTYLSLTNHKVKSTRLITYETPVPVYDITVDEHHNFALTAGVVVHNSLRDVAGLPTTSSYKLLRLKDKLMACLAVSPIFPDVIQLDFEDQTDQIANYTSMPGYFKNPMSKHCPRYIHIDTALSGDRLGIASSYVSEFKQVTYRDTVTFQEVTENLPVVVTEWVIGIEAKPGKQIPLYKTRSFIKWLAQCGFLIKQVTTDGFQCFTGDTKISLLDGTEVPIQDLVGREEFWVYSCKPDGTIVPGRGHSARKTGEQAPLLKITLDNGESIRCTHNHKFLLRNGEYKEARLLSPEDSLMPLYRDYSMTYEQFYNPRTKSLKYTHVTVAKHKFSHYKPSRYDQPEGHKIHHLNFKKLDNSPDNLAFCENTKEHMQKYHNFTPPGVGWKAIWANEETRDRKSKQTSKQLSSQWEVEEYRAKMLPGFLESGKVGAQNKERRRKASEHCTRMNQSAVPPHRNTSVTCEMVFNSYQELGKMYKVAEALGVHRETVRGRLKEYHVKYPNNHKVVSVTEDGVEDVYDITVDEYHNFALTAGVFVHNSAEIQQGLQLLGFNTTLFSVDRDVNPYMRFRDLIYHGMVSVPQNAILKRELMELEVTPDGKKVDHPRKNSDNSTGSKDIADACCGSVVQATLKCHEDKLAHYSHQQSQTKDLVAESVRSMFGWNQ